MSSCSAAPSPEASGINDQTTVPVVISLCKNTECPSEHEDEEKDDDEDEEDLDFNPFLKQTPSREASSSLSSEVEGFDANVFDSGGSPCAPAASTVFLKAPTHVQVVGDPVNGQDIFMEASVPSGGEFKRGSGETFSAGFMDRASVSIPQPEAVTFPENDNGSSSGIDVVNDVMVGNISNSNQLIMDASDEDAICRRTRARYSLTSFTLDELETFLQETDDDDDLQNIDDEDEYRKFLAAVLQGGDGENQAEQGNENVDDEDEDNDADFELEIEEALESDIDENIRDVTKEHVTASRRPETRQNRRRRASDRPKQKISAQLNRPLRPLLPIASFPALDRKRLIVENTPYSFSSFLNNGSINGFTPHQIGQLHCLIHEHVQLLVQMFSICVLEPSRQHIASQVRELMLEILRMRDQVLAWRRVPYPGFCFFPPYILPSVADELPQVSQAQRTSGSSSTFGVRGLCYFGNNVVPTDTTSPSRVGYDYVSSGQVGHFQTSEASLWVPFISGLVLSVADVAPLNLIGRYVDDVSSAVQEYRQHLGINSDTSSEREPLFPFQSFQPSAEVNEVSKGTVSPASNIEPSTSASDQPSKKTMAAALVEKTKSQSIAYVPKKIAKLAQRFFPLFNPALFPHKPPPVSVANRVLFTDAEDELLAMGLMEYNTDWKAIQQRFLPCKSKHQIYVRQKNRSASRAPENSIKAVRRIKNSPLSAEEKVRIEEGLKVFKFDWMTIWKFIVPHRDPSLLPRQWRIATGTQKSYKSDANKKEMRRLYESNRRKFKPAALLRSQALSDKEDYKNAGGENNSGDDCVDNVDETYVHEAFLADWRPGIPGVSSRFPITNYGGQNQPTFLVQDGSHARAQISNSHSGGPQQKIGLELPAASQNSHHPHNSSHLAHARHGASSSHLNHLVPETAPINSHYTSRSYRGRRTNSSRLVKLAPDLPPVNLPASVRVMSQSAFKTYKGGASTKVSGAEDGFGSLGKDNTESGTDHPTKSGQHEVDSRLPLLHSRDPDELGDKHAAEEKDESDFHMHPLLFQVPVDRHFPYYPLNCSTSPNSFNFFPRSQPQLDLSLFRTPQQTNHTVNFFDKSQKSKKRSSSPFGVDFHPLLQRTEHLDSDPVITDSAARLSSSSELSKAQHGQLQTSPAAVPSKSPFNGQMVACAIPTNPNEKSNELDLEIHLSCTSKKQKVGESREFTGSAQHSGITEVQDSKNMLYRHSKYTAAGSIVDGIRNKLDSGARALVISGNDANRKSGNNIRDQSLPEIVMEQEELSDSEEETAEDVEFECEEMTDSEGEDTSDSEQIENLKIKEVPSVVKKNVDTHFEDQQHESGVQDDSECNVRDHGKHDIPSSSLCLNLNMPSAPGSPQIEANDPLFKNAGASAGKQQALSRSYLSCDSTTPHVKSLAVTPSRKSRKRAHRTDVCLNKTCVDVELNSHISNNEIG